MGNFNDTIIDAMENGILLDKCGSAERYYDFGVYHDFCGMTPQEILENMKNAGCGGGGSSTTYTFTQVVDGVKTTIKAETGTLQTVTCDYSSIYPAEGYTISWSIPSTVTIIESGETFVKFIMPSANVNITAMHIKKVFVITFIDELGEHKKEVAYDVMPSYSAAGKEGYSFDKWEPELVKVTSDAIYTAAYKKNMYTVSYKIDGVIKHVDTVEFESVIPSWTPEEKEGYTFNGWEGIPATMPAKNIIINGSYRINEHTITINGIEYTINYGTNIPEFINDKIGGVANFYNRTIAPDIATMPDYNLIITVEDTPIEYKLTYTDADGNKKQENINVLNWENVINNIIAENEKDGYLVKVSGKPTTFSGDIDNLTVTRELIPYTLHWELDGNSGDVTYNIENNNVNELLSGVYNHDKYEISAWKDGEGNIVTELGIGGASLIADATVKKYKLDINPIDDRYTIKVNGEVYDSNKEYAYDTKDIEVIVTINETAKYNFIGGGDTYITTIESVGTSNVINIPGVEGDVYTLTYLVDGEQYGEVEYHKFNDPITMRETPSRTGYTVEWNNKYTTMPAENVTISANFIPNKYTITIDGLDNYIVKVNGADYNPSDEFDFGSEISVELTLTEDAKKKYQFNDGSDTITETVTVGLNTVIDPILKLKQYTITVTGDEHLIVSGTQTVDYGTIVEIEAIGKEGYLFNQWSDGDINAKREVVVTENIELNATSKIRTDIRLSIHSGAESDADKYIVTIEPNKDAYTYGENVTITATLKPEYQSEYHFENGDDVFTNNVIVTIPNDETEYNITIPQLVKDVYTVKFVNYDGTTLQEEQLAYGETPSYRGIVPVRQEDKGYTYEFKEWDPVIEVVTKNVVYTAIFEATAKQFNITVTPDQLDKVETMTITPEPVDGKIAYNTEVTVTIVPVDGYKVNGWINNQLTFTVTGDTNIIAEMIAIPAVRNKVFYGAIKKGELDTLDLASGLDGYEYEVNTPRGIQITIPANAEFLPKYESYIAGAIRAQEIRSWIENEDNYYVLLCAPATIGRNDIEMIGADGFSNWMDETTTDAENVNTAFNNIATKVVDGVEYTVWGWSDPVNKNTVAKDKFLVNTCGKDEDDVKSYTIKVKK